MPTRKPPCAGAVGVDPIEPRAPDGRSPSKETLEEVVRRILEVISPERIILFGSAARGEMRRDSDLDIMVVADVPKGANPMKLQGRIDGHLHWGEGAEIDFPTDVHLVSPETIRKFGDTIGCIYKPALKEGKILYERG